MLIQQLALDAAFATVRSAPTGLSESDAAARRLEFGPNRIERLARTSLTARVVRQFTHFFAALLWVAALLALIADWWMPGQGMLTLAAAIVAVIAINGAFSLWQDTAPKRRWPRCNVCFPTRCGCCGTGRPSCSRPRTSSPATSSS